MNILVPMAGRSAGFLKSKFKYPRYGIKINNQSVLDRSLRGLGEANYYFICYKQHFIKYGLRELILDKYPRAKVFLVETPTDGQACSAMWAEQFIGTDDPLLIISPMQVIDWDPAEFYEFVEGTDVDASIVVSDDIITATDPFYVKINYEAGIVRAIGDEPKQGWLCDCGVYYFKFGWYFTHWCKEMMKRNARAKRDRFYVAPCMNDGIVESKKIRPYLVNEVAILNKAHDLRHFTSVFPDWARP